MTNFKSGIEVSSLSERLRLTPDAASVQSQCWVCVCHLRERGFCHVDMSEMQKRI